MKGRTSSGRYRRNIYRKRILRNVIIITLIVILLSFIAFLIIGNKLKDKVEEHPSDDDDVAITTAQTNLPAQYTVSSRFVDISSASANDDSSAYAKQGYTSVSYRLSDTEGKPTYSSDVAKRFGYQAQGSNPADLKSLASSAQRRGLLVSGYFTLSSFSESDENIRSVISAYEAAMVCEVIELGVNDVILICPELSIELTDELVALADRVKSLNPDAALGIALSDSFLSSENSSVYVDKLMSAFDILALDVREKKLDAPIDFAESIVSKHLFYLLRYNGRVLIPILDSDDEREKLISKLAENSITNWQEIA